MSGVCWLFRPVGGAVPVEYGAATHALPAAERRAHRLCGTEHLEGPATPPRCLRGRKLRHAYEWLHG